MSRSSVPRTLDLRHQLMVFLAHPSPESASERTNAASFPVDLYWAFSWVTLGKPLGPSLRSSVDPRHDEDCFKPRWRERPYVASAAQMRMDLALNFGLGIGDTQAGQRRIEGDPQCGEEGLCAVQ